MKKLLKRIGRNAANPVSAVSAIDSDFEPQDFVWRIEEQKVSAPTLIDDPSFVSGGNSDGEVGGGSGSGSGSSVWV